MADLHNTFHARLSSLRSDYAAQLRGKIQLLEVTWERLQQQWNPELLSDFHYQIHNLAGSGATFGFVELSDTTRRVDRIVKTIIAQLGQPSDEQIKQITTLLNLLLQAVDDGEQARLSAAPSLSTLPPASDTTSNRLIFLVAEDTHAAQDLALQIGYFGYVVQVFDHSPNLPQAVHQHNPAAIVIDGNITEQGTRSAETIAAIQHNREAVLPILFVSSQNDLLSRLNAVRAGGSAYITKPINIGSLVDQLDILTNARTIEPYRILIVEDSRQLARYYTAILEHAGMVTNSVTDPLQVMQPLIEFRPDLILMDVYMPGCSGLELARVIRQQESFLSIPIVFLSAETDLNRQLAAMSLGGDEFLTKPIEPNHLVTAVTSRAERSRALRSFMIRDSLTGLLNHTATKEQLDRELARAARHSSSLALAVIDIDHFKLVNDTYGHPSGDQVLRSLARLLRQRLRKSDTIGRYGGEEFAVVLPETDAASAVRVLDAIREGFGQIRQRAEAETFSVTFSCGIAGYPSFGSATQLIDAADKALYEAKSAGRNLVRLANVTTPDITPQPPLHEILAASMVYDEPFLDELPNAYELAIQRVLVVDDDPNLNRLMQIWLSGRNFQVEAAFNGPQALEILAHTQIDLILLDLVLPGMSGLEVLDAVRQQNLDSAVIITTALSQEQMAIDALRRGADDYLRKPFQTREFQVAIERVNARLLLRRHNSLLRRQIGIA